MNHDTTRATSQIDDTMEASGQEQASKAPENTEYLDARQHTAAASGVRPSADSLFSSDLSMYTGDISGSHPHSNNDTLQASPSSAFGTPRSSRRKQSLRYILSKGWMHSKGMLMVIVSQFFGASMNVMTQLLERDGSHGKAMHPFQILFARMLITAAASYAYMWWTRVPDPFGTREVRWLLIARAVGGFFGVFGMYFSLLYMPLAEATVLTFLAPILACYACSVLLPNEPFTRKQQLAGLVSLLGVLLIARPFSGGKMEDGLDPEAFFNNKNSTMANNLGQADEEMETPSASQHLLAIGLSLVGVAGAACAYTTIRLIGSRAHALVSVTYFSTYTTIISIIAMLAIPSVSFRLPGSAAEWGLLLGLGFNGFTMQYLLTAGLAYKPSPSSSSTSTGHGTRATSMVYTQMLFALFYDKVIMDTSPSAISWAGSGLILGCALYVATVRDTTTSTTANKQDEEGIETEDRVPTGLEIGLVVDERGKDVEEGRGLLQTHDGTHDGEASR